VAAVLVTAGIRWSLTPLLGPQLPYTMFFMAVVCAAWYGGVGPGILAVFLSVLFAQFVFAESTFSLALSQAALIRGLIFVVVAMSCVMLSGSLHRASARAMQAEQRLRDVLASMADDFVTVDREWRVTFINPHATSSLGRRPGPIEGSILWQSFPEIVGTDL
jgi:K+-sensing histidine kinase KdpD